MLKEVMLTTDNWMTEAIWALWIGRLGFRIGRLGFRLEEVQDGI
jgi:hypothetical protein